MQDSDDNYFSDDLILDAQTLAVLEEEESKFKRNTASQPRNDFGPPAKRQKTEATWQPQSVNKAPRHTDTVDDFEDLPDVSVRHDGTYGLQDKQRHTASTSRMAIASGPSIPAASRPTTTAPTSRGSVLPARSASVTIPVRAPQSQSRPPPSRGTRVVPSPAPSQGSTRTQSPSLSQGAPRSQPRPPVVPPQRVVSTSSAVVSDPYVAGLHRQIEQLRKEKEAERAEKESAFEAKFSKEGEATILRKRLEKIAQEHSAQLAKLKAAKEESDAKHLVLQKQYEAEKERLKTELMFRRHEIETSTRKPPASDLFKSGVPQVAEPVPSQMQRWGQNSAAGPSRIVPDSPRRPRFGVISDFEKPKKSKMAETGGLPSGFQTGPPRSQTMAGRNGNETSSFTAPHGSFRIPGAVPPSQGSSSRIPQPDMAQPDMFADQMDDGGAIDSFNPQADIENNDVNLTNGHNLVSTPIAEDIVAVTLPSWNVILHDIILKHMMHKSEISTLQLLVSASIGDTQHLQSYGAALMQIFDVLGRISNHPDESFDPLARVVCSALCEIAGILTRSNLITPLTALLNLLVTLSYMLPPFHAILLLQRVEHEEAPQLLGVLHLIVQDQLQSLNIQNEERLPELSSLGRESLSLFDVLVWRVPDDLEDNLSSFSIDPSLLMTLLQHDRPMWFLIESMRVLVWLSRSRSLVPLLLRPENEPPGNGSGSVDPVHYPLINRACSLLTDTNRKGSEVDELKSLILMFFGVLSSTHPDVFSLLVETEELIPSIVLSLNQLVMPIWDENEALFNDAQVASRTTHMINHATLLLHHLVMGENTTLDLRDCLCRSPMKIYPGLIHLFILTFGRLSYATPPHWLDATDRNRLLQVAELARPLLELAIQGPELDSIWETYHDEAEENDEAAMDVDEEEAEAQIFADV